MTGPGAVTMRLQVENAPMMAAIDEVGDRWSLLIIWAAANDVSRFDDFQRTLNVARNILSNRLRRLVECGVLQKRPVREGARRMSYQLTSKGEALLPAIRQIGDWGQRWTEGPA